MIGIGRVCVKIAGRDAGLKCVVVDVLDKNSVLIDGQTRRRKCNITHLEPLDQMLDVSKGASHDQVVKAFKAVDVSVVERKTRSAVAHHRPVVKKAAPVEKPKAAKKPAVKKVAAKKE